jgi:hypothetical protein
MTSGSRKEAKIHQKFWVATKLKNLSVDNFSINFLVSVSKEILCQIPSNNIKRKCFFLSHPNKIASNL